MLKRGLQNKNVKTRTAVIQVSGPKERGYFGSRSEQMLANTRASKANVHPPVAL
jgi:hypothetical protein